MPTRMTRSDPVVPSLEAQRTHDLHVALLERQLLTAEEHGDIAAIAIINGKLRAAR